MGNQQFVFSRVIAQQEYFTANLDIAAQKYEETGHPESFVKWLFWRIFVFHGTGCRRLKQQFVQQFRAANK
jgi:hypothetical protein